MTQPLKVRGADEVVAGFEDLERFVDDMTEPNRRVLGPLVLEVAGRTPIRTGSLASSWSLTPSAQGGSIESGLEYAGPVEFGVEGRFEGAHMVLGVLESRGDQVVDGYEEAIADRARAIGFRVTR